MQPCSSEIAQAEDYRTRHAEEAGGMDRCADCFIFSSDVRNVFSNGITSPFCRECRPLDRPCEACGKAEAIEGYDGCLACTVEGDLHDVRAEIAGMA